MAKAAEIPGEKWTMLIVRELLMGATRFNELQRGLSLISPTLLTKRLNELSAAGVILKKKIQGQRGHEYLLTAKGGELLPVVEQMGEWGDALGTWDDVGYGTGCRTADGLSAAQHRCRTAPAQ